MVISGGHFKPEALKPKEVVSLLLDDAELECKCKLVLIGHSVVRKAPTFKTSPNAKPFGGKMVFNLKIDLNWFLCSTQDFALTLALLKICFQQLASSD